MNEYTVTFPKNRLESKMFTLRGPENELLGLMTVHHNCVHISGLKIKLEQREVKPDTGEKKVF